MFSIGETVVERSEVDQPLSQRLEDCAQRNAAVSWPLPIHQRLERFVQRANLQGAKTNRKEMSAALLLAHDGDSDALLRLVLNYRTATAREAVLDAPKNAKVVLIPRHKPGPRKSAS